MFTCVLRSAPSFYSNITENNNSWIYQWKSATQEHNAYINIGSWRVEQNICSG